jgi:DNA replication protein DnaC
MGYPKEVYAKAWQTLDNSRAAAEDSAARRREDARRLIPELGRLERRIADAGAAVSKLILHDPESAPQRLDKLKADSLALQKERDELLRAKGFPADYLAVSYACPACRDTGYIGREMCGCMRDLLRKAAYARLGSASQAQRCTFGGFSLSYYPAEPMENNAPSPRDRMTQVLAYCRRYAEGFSPASESILMLGHTGLGKTHLSLAIASAATEAGFGVVYTPVQKLMDKLEAEKFARSYAAKEQYTDSIDDVIGCDLLVLDDLGTEFHTQFTTSALYNIINSRMVEGRPTIINTNLELPQIEEKYSQRMISRLICGYKVLKFYGRDIRFVKKSTARE